MLDGPGTSPRPQRNDSPDPTEQLVVDTPTANKPDADGDLPDTRPSSSAGKLHANSIGPLPDAGPAGGGGPPAPLPLSATPAWFSQKTDVKALHNAPVGHFVRVPPAGGVSGAPAPLAPGGSWSFPAPVAPGGKAQIVYTSSGGAASGPTVAAHRKPGNAAPPAKPWQHTRPTALVEHEAKVEAAKLEAAKLEAAELAAAKLEAKNSAAKKFFAKESNAKPDAKMPAAAKPKAKRPEVKPYKRPDPTVEPSLQRRQEYIDWLRTKRDEQDPPFPRPGDATDATPEDIDAFKRVSAGNPGQTTADEVEYLKKIRAKYPNTYAHLTDDEMLIIRRYTGVDYTKLNTALRTGQGDDLAAWKSYEEALNAALSKLPRYEGPVVRGGNLPPQFSNMYQEGAIVEDKAFTSSCAGVDPPQAFVGAFEFHIQSKNGRLVEDLGVYGPYQNGDVTKNKWDPADHKDGRIDKSHRVDPTRESEVLFASNTKFLVQSREDNVQVWNTFKKKFETKTVIHMEEL